MNDDAPHNPQAAPRYGAHQPPPPPPPPGYGQQPYGTMAPPPFMHPMQKPYSNMAIISIVMGGVSVLMWPLAPITGIVGIILGVMGMKQSKEPGATHRGWGMALAGLLMSAFMLLISIAMIGVIVWAISFAEKQQGKFEQQAREAYVHDDLSTIRRRMDTYYLENGRSFGPGGPIVNDGRQGLYPEDTPKVEGKLKLNDLVVPMDLNKPFSEYTLDVKGDNRATVTHNPSGARLVINDMDKEDWRIEGANH